MKIGIFIPNANNGFIMSEAAPQYRPTFAFEKELVQKADKYGMEFALSLVKYRGFGGKTDHWHWSLDSFTLSAGLAAVTERIKLIGSVGILAHHPAHFRQQRGRAEGDQQALIGRRRESRSRGQIDRHHPLHHG